jgi:hypothetical protein
MKKLLLLVFAIAGMTLSSLAQLNPNNFYLSGYVTDINTGFAIDNHLVTVNYNMGFLNFTDSTFTNANGYYSFEIIDGSLIGPNINYIATVLDCNQQPISQTAANMQGTVDTATVNFQICTFQQGSCNNTFTTFIDTTNPAGILVTFIATASPAAVSYSYQFDSGMTLNTPNPTVGLNPGMHLVCLTTTTATGCTAVFCDTVVVPGSTMNCTADLSSTANGLTVTFSPFNLTGTPPFTFTYSYGDGTTGTSNVHVYQGPTIYQACVAVTDANGCVANACTLVNLTTSSNCSNSFTFMVDTANSNPSGTQVNFYSTASPAAVSYLWSVTTANGMNITDNNANPFFMLPDGMNIVCLQTTTANNCVANYCDSVLVNNSGGGGSCSVALNYNILQGNTVQFSISGYGLLTPQSILYLYGDGNSGSNAIYSYNSNGIFNACVVVSFTNGCTATACTNVNLLPANNYMLHVNLFAGANPGTNGTVYIITYNAATQTLNAMDSIFVDTAGLYMTVVPAGQYLLKGALNPGNPDYANYLPTYHDDVLYWANSSLITIPDPAIGNGIYSYSINLLAGNNPGGPGFVGGLVTQGANRSAGPGDPMEGVNILLFDAQGSNVTHTASNASGNYSFSNLAFGGYYIYPEMINRVTYPIYVEISAATPALNNINISVESQLISGMENNVKLQLEAALYPNPVHDVLNINITSKENQMAYLEIVDVRGRKIFEQQSNIVNGTNIYQINCTTYQNGLYFIRIIDSSNNILLTRPVVIGH